MATDKQHPLARGILLFAVAILVFLSLLSYQPGDVGHAAGGAVVFNYIGQVGAWIALGLFLVLGWGAWAVPVFVLGESLIALIPPSQERLSFSRRFPLEILATLSFSPLFSIQNTIPASRIGWELEGMGLGGCWGKLAGNFLYQYLGLLGSRLVLITVLALALALITEMKPLIWVGNLIAALGRGVAAMFKRKPRAAAPPARPRPSLRPPVRPSRGPARVRRKPVKTARSSSSRQRELILKQTSAQKDKLAQEKKTLAQREKRLAQREKQLEQEAKLRQKEAKKSKSRRKIEVKAAAAKLRPSSRKKSPKPKKENGKAQAPQLILPRQEKKSRVAPPPSGPYRLPPTSILNAPPAKSYRGNNTSSSQLGKVLEESLLDYGIEAKVVGMEVGPAITRYELEPAPGVKVGRIKALENDIALTMKATSVRILAPIPGKGAIGIEIPNPSTTVVCLREMVEAPNFARKKHILPLTVGMDLGGKPVITDLVKIPHLLIAGATGSGKTVCINSIIMSFLYSRTPDEMKMIMVDPKKVEMTQYKKIPHLICPVITDAPKASMALNWLVREMENRYDLFAKVPVRNIEGYNNRDRSGDEEGMPEKVPYIVLLIDELADLMLTAPREIESAIARLAHLSRAVGIHMILATQRPSVDVITGVIKANFPGRISFKVSAKVDSRTVLDAGGADKLLGNGDLLFVPPGTSTMVRAQGTFCSDQEIDSVVKYVTGQRRPEFKDEIFSRTAAAAAAGGKPAESKDPVVEASIDVIRETGQASVSVLQRKLKIGYSRAARVMDTLEEMGVVGPHRGMKAREILIETFADQQKKPEE